MGGERGKEDAAPGGSVHALIVSSYNDRIRPLLDAVDRLRHLKIMQEGIQLPTIVVVGDQSSGKSSVLESLAGISVPRGQGICTRVPLIMRLQNHLSPEPELFLECDGRVVPTDEEHVADAIVMDTDDIAGKGKGISNHPVTLIVKKKGVPDLTMVDLPGITRVPVHGQPEDIYEQISKIIMEFITPEESIILNVLSASVDFTTCESIRMSQQVDKTGQRTLAVVTKADKAAEGLLEKVTSDDVNIGLGYICVRNRIGDESYEQARAEEKTWSYVENVVVSVLMRHSDNYPQLLSSTRRAAQNLVALKKQQSVDWVIDIVEMEKLTDYTCNPDYVALWNKLMSHQNAFMEILNDHSKPTEMHIDGFGHIDVAHLRSHVVIVQEAFDLKMRLTAYWKIILRRLVDCMALHLLFIIQNLVNKEMEVEIIKEIIGPEGNGLQRMLEESPTIAEKRKRLNNSIKLLKESKDVVAKIIDNITTLSLGKQMYPSDL
ncbi:hypothetical protein Pfo_025392 [Paulownia fortunei]|nr:hypothetical protein Pfo_025392 [Paulownia fortunei]